MNKKLLLLALLNASTDEKIDGITRFQKIVFLLQQEKDMDGLYEFRPGSYGPFSKSLYDDIDRLVTDGFMTNGTEPTSRPSSNNKQIYQLSEKGKRALTQGIDEEETFKIEELQEKLGRYYQMELWDLLEYVYSEYPDMAVNSKLNI